MKAMYFHAAGALALTFTIAACASGSANYVAAPVTQTQTAPAPTPTPAPPPAPLPVISEPSFDNYLDAPQTQGDWGYFDEPDETLATYGIGSDFQFIVRCDRSNGAIGLARVTQTRSEAPRAMEISTETTTRQLVARPVGGNLNIVAATLTAADPLLDAMAITKGRVAIGVEGERTLYLPAWVEISRVIEDCR